MIFIFVYILCAKKIYSVLDFLDLLFLCPSDCFSVRVRFFSELFVEFKINRNKRSINVVLEPLRI